MSLKRGAILVKVRCGAGTLPKNDNCQLSLKDTVRMNNYIEKLYAQTTGTTQGILDSFEKRHLFSIPC